MAEERQTYRKKAARNASDQRTRQISRSNGTASRSSRASSTSGKSPKAKEKSVVSRLSDAVDSAIAGSIGKKKDAKRAGSSRGARSGAQAMTVDSFKTRFLSSRVAMIIAAVIVVLLVVVLWDNVANMGKAYGNVMVNGESVSGMNAEQIRSKLEEDYGSKLSSSDVRIYASEESQKRESSDVARQENAAQAEQVSVEDAKASVTSWVTNASGLRATIPYDQVIEQALSAGRDDGPLGRLALFVSPRDVEMKVSYDEEALEELASAIDSTIGDQRIDATVEIAEGQANAVKGHDGKMVDRAWLSNQITDTLMSESDDKSFIAQVVDAPSRTSYEQAQQMSSSVNRALNSQLTFTYHTQSWTAEPSTLGDWTVVEVSQADDGYELTAHIDESLATSDLAKHLDATSTGQNVIVDFEKSGDEILAKTSGSGIIPEVAPAVKKAGETLYGDAGVAWGSASSGATIQVEESDAPEQLTFEQAVDLGVVSVIGEYTTEFSNAEGTENRNHNIQVASDLLNNTIAESNGGKWSFNDNSGDTNLDPPFASAGSIVDGEYVDSIGGGICQVATTIFNAVYEAGLDIVERRNHSLYIASYPTGRDAAVSYPEMDFVWSNPLESDVLLTLEYTDTTLTAKLYGTPTGYHVTTDTGQWEEGEKYHTTFETDDSLGEGSYYLKTTGSDGSQIAVTRTVYDINNNVVKEDSFSSIYSPKDEVYLIGPGTDTSVITQAGGDSGNTIDEYEEWESDAYDESSTEGFYVEPEYDDSTVYQEGYEDYSDEQYYEG